MIRHRRVTFGWAAALLGSLVAFGAAGEMAEVWIHAGESVPARHLTISSESVGSQSVAEAVRFNFAIESKFHFEDTRVRIQIVDAGGLVVSEGIQAIDVYVGRNEVTFKWDASTCPEGDYSIEVSADYTDSYRPASYYQTIEKVTSGDLMTRLDAVEHRLALIRGRVDRYLGPAETSPYLDMRLRVARDFFSMARGEAADGDWHAMEGHVSYLEEVAESTAARLAFGLDLPEWRVGPPRLDLDDVVVRDGSFYVGDRPVFLFGQVVGVDDPASMDRLARYGLNLAVFSIGPNDTLAGLDVVRPFDRRFDPIFERAARDNIALAVHLAPQDLAGWALDEWPDLLDKGFPDLVHPGAARTYHRHMEAVIPYLTRKPMVTAASIVETPRFMFGGEEIRREFVARVAQLYPDRIELNRAWHAHLGNLDEITIWDTEAPAHSYHHRPAYQYDWQAFHRGLVLEYIEWVESAIHRMAPELPLLATLEDNAFELSETRDGVDREAVARLLDLTGCTAQASAGDPVYALSYPRPSAFYNLMRSLEPNKPVVNMDDRLDLGPGVSPGFAADYVRTALWEAVMAGLSATALSPDSAVFEEPSALEAFSIAAMSINRLAPIVHAFQMAPADVMILFSESSKIFNDGDPHLKSAWFAYEGCSFSGYNLRYVTEDQIAAGALADAKVLVVPETPSLRQEVFDELAAYVEDEGTIARVGTPIPYDERGYSRQQVVRNTGKTVLVRGMNLPTEYLHAMDAAMVVGALPRIPRPVNAYGHPLEGVKSRYVEYKGEHYLYLVNLRKDAVNCWLAGHHRQGRDLIWGRDLVFPCMIAPLDPVLIRLEESDPGVEMAAVEMGPP